MEQQERENCVFAGEGKEEVILCMALTPDFLIYATEVMALNCTVLYTTPPTAIYAMNLLLLFSNKMSLKFTHGIIPLLFYLLSFIVP